MGTGDDESRTSRSDGAMDGGAMDDGAHKSRPRHFTLLRSFALADFVTLANGAAGTGAILLCLA